MHQVGGPLCARQIQTTAEKMAAVDGCCVEIVHVNEAGTAIQRMKDTKCAIRLGRDELDGALAVSIELSKVGSLLPTMSHLFAPRNQSNASPLGAEQHCMVNLHMRGKPPYDLLHSA